MAGRPRRPLKIVAMGDSTTAGTPGFLSPVESPPNGAGNKQSQYAYWMMKEHPDWIVLNKGVNGERTDQILSRFRRDVVEQRPTVTVILGGVNDIYQGYPPEFPARNLGEMYAKAADARITVVTCTVLPYNTMGEKEVVTRDELNSWVREESVNRRLFFCDTAAEVSDPLNRNRLAGSPDGLHPDVEGYRKMALAVSKVVQASLGDH